MHILTREPWGQSSAERYLAVLRNPANYRPGLPAYWLRVFDVAAELDEAMENRALPRSASLSMDLPRLAKTDGCRISLGTDSHGASHLTFIEPGLASALLGGIKRERILNFMKREQLLAWVVTVQEEGRSLR